MTSKRETLVPGDPRHLAGGRSSDGVFSRQPFRDTQVPRSISYFVTAARHIPLPSSQRRCGYLERCKAEVPGDNRARPRTTPALLATRCTCKRHRGVRYFFNPATIEKQKGDAKDPLLLSTLNSPSKDYFSILAMKLIVSNC